MYPMNYTVFMRKVNALFEGDENGDYVMAEDVNELQEAIERLERRLGITTSSETVEERIQALRGMQPMRMKTMFRQGATLIINEDAVGVLSSYDMVSLRAVNVPVMAPLKQKGVELVVDVVVGATPLSQVQMDIGSAAGAGADIIWLRAFAWADGVDRMKQKAVLESVRQAGLKVLLSLTPEEVESDVFDAVNNAGAEALSLAEDVYMDMGSLLMDGVGYASASTLVARTSAYLQLKSRYGARLLFHADEASYTYAQATGILFSMDMLALEQTMVRQIPEWSAPAGDWRTDSLETVYTGNGLKRYVKGGSIEIDTTNGSYDLKGFRVLSQDIGFSEQSVPGSALIDGSITKEKIGSYDGDEIARTLNEETTTKIKWTAIEDMGSEMLPGNIPASNMQENVIAAINQQAGDFVEKLDIVDDAIKTLSATKLTGNIHQAQMTNNVISAINAAPGSIDVATGRIDAFSGDTVNVIDVTTQTINGQILNVTEGFIGDFSANNIESLMRIDAKDIFAQYIKTIQLDADVLKVKDMLVDDLISEKITAETLTAVMAHIGTAEINNLVAESIKAQIVKSELIVSVNSMVGQATINGAIIGEGSIVDAQIVSLNAGKINAGSINTGLVTLDSPDGHLRISDESIKIYDAADVNGIRRMRTILGNTGEIVPGTYGLVVLGEDGTTRLYDNTGVYNAGIHENAISNEKLQEDSVDGRVIIANSIIAEHITADAITAEKIKAGEINALHIAAGTITAGSAIIADAAIGNAKISDLDGGKITADSIDGRSIKAGTITTDLLSVGFGHNQMKYGYDSFEIFVEGESPVDVFTPMTNAVVSKDIRRVGDYSLKIDGNNTEHVVYLQKMAGNHLNALVGGKTYYVSAFMYTTDATGVDVYTGLVHNTGTLWGNVKRIKQSDGFVRVVSEITIPEGVISGTVALKTVKANAIVYVDCVMLEEKEQTATEPSMWVSASITEVSGDMITTGVINATKGITFQAGAVVIDANGIKLSKPGGGSVTINNDGLVIKGGAITIEGGLDEEDLNPALTSKWNSAVDSIGDLIDNNIITVYEKYGLQQEWERIVTAFDSTWSQATTYEITGDVRIAEYVNAKNALQNYLFTTLDLNNNLPILDPANSNNDSEINGADYAGFAKQVYDKSVLAQEAVLAAMQSDIDKTRQDLEELDISPIYRVDIISSKGLLFKNGNVETVLRAQVWRGSIDITDTTDASAFTWKRISEDATADAAWNAVNGQGVKSIVIDGDDVNVKATFTCDLDIIL